MRFCVSCVYWTLLLVSVVSSGLLFLIVASEGTHVSDKPRGIEQEEKIQSENAVKEIDAARSEDKKIPDVRARPTVKTEQQHFHAAQSDAGLQDEETLEKDSESQHNLNVLKQSLTPQPNFSQGISETGQAVVLTLVDTAAAELQSLAEPRLSSDIRSRSLPKNVTLRTTTTGPIPATTSTTSSTTFKTLETEQATEQETKSSSNPLPIVPLATETSGNATKTPPERQDETTASQDAASDSKDEASPVKAEGKSAEETTNRHPEDTREDEPKDETLKPEENLPPSPELDDGAVRAKLGGGSSDEAAAVILDGLVASGSTDHHHEDIPSFSEWAQKRLEEAEKKKSVVPGHPNASIQNPGGPGRGLGGMKMRSKNYASPDCGAKIVAVNPEARSARSVLVSTRDEYMLNPCTSRVWFVVELCEAIQAKKIELANFELFSSSPKDFSVHVSDRFPTRDWSPVGQFTAKDQRDIQSFSLSPHLFGKFIKIELHSHYGSEHFCPISLFRAYGTSEFEVLETETDHQESEEDENNEDEDEDETLDSEAGAETRNLFGSARDAVLRIVKKAAEVLVKTGDASSNITQIQENIEATGNFFATCTTPRYAIFCANCEDDRFAAVYELLSCRARQLDEILSNDFVHETLRNGDFCSPYGFEPAKNASSSIPEENDVETWEKKFPSSRAEFLVSIYPPDYITALCNVIATKEGRVVLNTSHESSSNVSLDSSTKIDANSANSETPEANGARLVASTPCQPEVDGNSCQNSLATKETKISKIQASEQETSSSMRPESVTSKAESLASQIKPTKALSREDIRKESSAPILEPSKDPNEESIQPEVLTTPSPALNVAATATTRIIDEPETLQSPLESTTQILTTLVAPPSTSTSRDSQQELNFASQENTPENPSPIKLENLELDPKSSGKPENGEQEAKLIAQDQMSLDSILSDLKDLETDPTQANSNHNPNVVAQPTASSTPQQKESVFLRLSNRIKALERNMSLSGQYLEELSKRYKKQVEEMQRSLERATSAMSEEWRKGEERDLRRIEEITALRSEITSLTESLETLLYDRNSWRSKLSSVCQHFALVVVEIVVFMLVVSYCRRSSEFEDVEASGVSSEKPVQRRRSAGAISTCGATSKKSKKRRPSEIASRIAGTYRDLMIDDRANRETKKDKKKRRKRESNGRNASGETGRRETSPEDNFPGGTSLPSRRSSSTEPASSHARQLELRNTRKRPDSAPEYSGLWIENSSILEASVLDENFETVDDESMPENKNGRRSLIEEMSALNFYSEAPIERNPEQEKSTGLSLFRAGGFFKSAKLSSPSFMKTALGSRSKRFARASTKNDNNPQLMSENWEWYSRNSSTRSDSPSSMAIDQSDSMSNGQEENVAAKNGHHRGTSNQSESPSSTTSPTTKRDKKMPRGLRKMCDGRKTLGGPDLRHSQRVVAL